MIYCSHKNKFLIIWYFMHQIALKGVYSHIHSIKQVNLWILPSYANQRRVSVLQSNSTGMRCH